MLFIVLVLSRIGVEMRRDDNQQVGFLQRPVFRAHGCALVGQTNAA
jgi:hypothetical protein